LFQLGIGLSVVGGIGQGIVIGWLVIGWLAGARRRQRLVLLVAAAIGGLGVETWLLADHYAIFAFLLATVCGAMAQIGWRWRLVTRRGGVRLDG
jgi:hypothetical protein